MPTVVDGAEHVVRCSLAGFAAWNLISRISWGVFWPYFAGTVLLAIGLPIVIKNEVPEAHGLDKIMPFGRLFFSVPMAVFGAYHFTATRFVVLVVPSWIPAHRFWVYLVGIALFAAALSIVVRIQAPLAATLLAIMLFLFVVLIHIPNVVANPHNRIAWTAGLRDLAFSGGAFAFAGSQRKGSLKNGAPLLVTLARFFVAVPTLFFGVEHFLHPNFAPGVPLDLLTPTWIPGRLFFAYLAGAVLVVAGASLLVKQKARLAAASLGIMIFLLVLSIYLPILAANPSDIDNGLNYFVDTLMFSGAALLLADAMPREDRPHV